jgi:hypothetical protein
MQNAKYVKLPIDVFTIKQKFIAGLTKRQAFCFVIAAVCGAVPFFIVKSFAGTTPAIVALLIFAFPPVICGIYEKNGIKIENYAKLMINFWRSPKKRIYKARPLAEYIALIAEEKELKRRLKNGS